MIALYILLALLAMLIIVLAVNTIRKRPQPVKPVPAMPLAIDEDALAKHLSGMIRFKTMTSNTMEGFDRKEFLGLHRYLEDTYPLVHKTLKKEVINEYSLLYHWKGSGSDKKPYLMMAHIDVVPVEEASAGQWKHSAFSGDIADGYVWGRGAIDMKGQVAAIFECAEHLIREGFTPKRDIYIAIGHDEESMGQYGTNQIVALLEKKGVRLEFVFDEGGAVMNGRILGIQAMIAAVGICEKGYADFKLTARSQGGHASRPPRETAVGRLAKAIVAVEKHQMKYALNEPMRAMIGALGGYMKFPLNVIAANLLLTKRLLIKGFASGNMGAAMVHTTVAPTMLKGSSAPNVLADCAEAVVNVRIAPGQTVEDVKRHFEKVTRDRVEISLIQGYDPSVVSGTNNEAYRMITRTLNSAFPDYVVAPYLLMAATDSRWYAPIAEGMYRFQPFRSMDEDLGTIHAVGERLSVESLREGTEFFIFLVKNADE